MQLLKFFLVVLAICCACFGMLQIPPGMFANILYASLIGAIVLAVVIVVMHYQRSQHRETLRTLTMLQHESNKMHYSQMNMAFARLDNAYSRRVSEDARALIDKRLEQGVRIVEGRNGEYFLSVPRVGYIDAIGEAKMNYDEINYMLEEQEKQTLPLPPPSVN